MANLLSNLWDNKHSLPLGAYNFLVLTPSIFGLCPWGVRIFRWPKCLVTFVRWLFHWVTHVTQFCLNRIDFLFWDMVSTTRRGLLSLFWTPPNLLKSLSSNCLLNSADQCQQHLLSSSHMLSKKKVIYIPFSIMPENTSLRSKTMTQQRSVKSSQRHVSRDVEDTHHIHGSLMLLMPFTLALIVSFSQAQDLAKVCLLWCSQCSAKTRYYWLFHPWTCLRRIK